MPLPVPVTMDPGSPRQGGLLATARALPAGWERGIAWADDSCTLPTVMGECPTQDDLKPAQPLTDEVFRPVELIQTIACTTFGGGPAGLAGPALDQTRDYALAREMLTGEASARDAAVPENANPALVDTAVDLGEFVFLAQAVACLEQRLAAATGGRGGYLLAGLDMATHLLANRLVWRDGARWRTAGGSTVIVSAGFDGRAPGDTAPPPAGQALTLYAVPNVWAGVGSRSALFDVNRSDNTATDRAEDIALVAFSTCAVFAASSPEATSCGTDESP